MHSKLKKLLALALCFAFVLSTSTFSVYGDEDDTDDTSVSDSADESDDSDEEEEEEEIPRTEEEALAAAELVCENGYLKLYMNADEGTIALEDTRNGEIWWSNPVDVDTSSAKPAQKKDLKAGMSLVYAQPANRSTTTVNSQNKGDFEMTKTENGVDIVYTFPDPGITVPVSITLEDGYLKLYCDTSEIVEEYPSSSSGMLTTKVAFMKTFGAASMDEDGYFVIPDGSGAVINFNNGKTNLRVYSGKVYGNDLTAVSLTKTTTNLTVNLPMYGIVKENAGLMVVADKGDTCATINSYVSNQNNNDYNSTYFDFELRTTDQYYMSGDSNPLTVFEKRGILVPEIELRYYPIATDDGEVDYVDVADTYRDYLMTEKAVDDKDLTDEVSLFVDFYGGTLQQKSVLGLPVTVKEKVTTFDKAQEILTELNGLGVDSMVATYNNFSTEDISEKITDSFNPASVLGGKSDFSDLYDYCNENGIQLFPSTDNQQFRTGNGYWSMTNTAIRVSNAYARIIVYDLAHGTENQYYDARSLFSPASYTKAFTKLISSYAKNEISNIAFGSLANSIYGDYGKKAVSREIAKGYVEEIYSDAASQIGNVLAENAFAYTLPYVDYITNIPVCSSKYDIFDYDIPFYQMVLHGITSYASTAVNGDADISELILTSLAAGSNLSFDFVGITADELKDTKLDSYYYAYYGNWMDEAAGVYQLSCDVLTEAADAQIVEYNISDDGNEIETVYSNGYTTVVNFNDNTVTAGSKTYNLADYVGEEVLGE